MIPALVAFGVTALLFSLPMAGVAWLADRRGRWPALAHLLWVFVIVKMLVPGVVAMPGVELPLPAGWHAPTSLEAPSEEWLGSRAGWSTERAALLDAKPLVRGAPELLRDAAAWFVSVWLLGSASLLAVSSARVFRFHSLLRRACQPAESPITAVARELSRELGQRRAPQVLVVASRVSPLVWWRRGRAVVVVPRGLTEGGREEELRWALAHELGHLHRRDHWVRWVEWLAVLVFWWNPVSWWARRSLRRNEEACCDQLVLQRLQPRPKIYANSLLQVAEFLARPALRPPVVASALLRGGSLENRIQMILHQRSRPMPRSLRLLTSAAILALLPLGIAQAQAPDAAGEARTASASQDPERTITIEQYKKAAAEIEKAVAAGKISEADAEKRLAEMRARIRDDKADSDRTLTVEQYKKAAAEIKKAVAAGKISEADAEKRLAEMRARIRDDKADSDRTITPEQFKKAAAEMKKAVDAGKISEADAKKKLAELKKRVRKDSPDQDRVEDRPR